MSEEITAQEPKRDEEDKQNAAESTAPQKEAPIPFTGFKGIFSLKSKNQSAKERFSQKA